MKIKGLGDRKKPDDPVLKRVHENFTEIVGFSEVQAICSPHHPPKLNMLLYATTNNRIDIYCHQ